MNKIHIVLGLNAGYMKRFARNLFSNSDDAPFVYLFPESELHPSTHGALVENFTSLPDPVIIATHSEIIVLRLLRMVAEYRLKPELLTITWLGSDTAELMNIVVDCTGQVNTWPDGVFSDAVVEFRAIQIAQLVANRQ